ncbi:MAG: Maf family nucleotide pyrophosphatase [Desulfovibrionaceae bacterium]|nr:Maf family nucleotide pyrophosphatase [Desulfovibrionaceae bacterium]
MGEGLEKPLFRPAPGMRLVLASGSPRRRQFLAEWGVPFAVRPVAGEPDPKADEPAADFVARCAAYKLDHAERAEGETVIAADTVVALDDRIMGKPDGEAGALAMLQALAGRDHQVITAVAVEFPDGSRACTADVCHVHMQAWGTEALQAYVGTGECLDKAGAYAIQGIGAFLVDRIDGSWSTVVGLPVSWLARQLADRGVIVPALRKAGEQA